MICLKHKFIPVLISQHSERDNDKMKMDEDSDSSVGSKHSFIQKLWKFCLSNLLLILLVLSLALGIGLGAGLRAVEPPFDPRQILYLRFPGDLLLSMLKMLILPLIISSLISGLASLDTRSSGKMGARAVIYYLTTTFAAVVLGIILTISIQPGYRGGKAAESSEGAVRAVTPADTFLDLLRQCFPDNLIEACFRKPLTQQVERETETTMTTTMLSVNVTDSVSVTDATTHGDENNSTVEEPSKIFDPVVTKVEGMNILGLVVFSVFFGVIIGRMGEKGKPLVDLFDSLCEATMRLVRLVIWYSPIGVMFLIAAKVVEMEDPEVMFQRLLFYFITVLTGLFIHAVVTLPLVYFIIVRKNPFKFIYGVVEAMVTALATSSSSATLPVTMRCLEEKNGIDARITKFVAPVGATINMDGTALYEAVAVLFIGQLQGYDLSVGQVITVSITATAAAIGAAGVPQAGLVTMVIVLTAVGFPTDDVSIILAVDWLLDRFRTAINVMGDAIGAGIVAHLSQKELDDMDEQDTTMTTTDAGSISKSMEMKEVLEDDCSKGHINTGYMCDKL